MLGKLSQRLGVLTVYIHVLLTFLLGPGLEVYVTATISALLEPVTFSLKVIADTHLEGHPNCAPVCFLLSGHLES